MEKKIEEIYEFLCDDKFLDVLDERYRDYVNEVYYEIFKGDKTDFDNIAWHVVIDGIIRFEYMHLINNSDKNKDNLIDEYFKNIPNRREEIVNIAELVEKYSDIKMKSKLTSNKDDYDDFIIID